MSYRVLIFVIVFLLNLIPAFSPPTWMVFSFIGFNYPASHVIELALIGAVAATAGRLVLAKLARVIIRQRFLSGDTKRNIDAIREYLEGRETLTFSLMLFYAFSPLPSNFVFLAYGLTDMDLKYIAVPFLIGRAVSYSLWGHGSSALSHWLDMGSGSATPYFTVYLIVSQAILLYLVYLFTKIDWRALITEKKLRKLRPVPTARLS